MSYNSVFAFMYLVYIWFPFFVIIILFISLSYLIFSFLLFGWFDECLIFSLINESFSKSGNDIYFCFLFWLSGLNNYFSVCVLNGALSLFPILFLLHVCCFSYIQALLFIFLSIFLG